MAAKRQVFITAKGIAAPYAALQKPDFGTKEFPQPRGEYKVNLIVPLKEAKADMERITKLYDSSYAEFVAEHEANPPKVAAGKRPVPVRQGDLPFFDNGDGTVTFKFKCYASFEKDGEKKEITIRVADSRGKTMSVVPNISGGSTLKIRYSMFPYKWNTAVGASVKLQLEGAMLIDLVEFGGGDDDWGDVEEGGYVADETKQKAEWDEEPSGHASEEVPDADDDF
jgi:hypothetical protein